MKKILLLVFVVIIGVVSCSDENSTEDTNDNFDRKAMLIHIADNIIIPGYESFYEKITFLETATSDFIATPDEANLIKIRNTWKDAYISWQSISMFQIGKAEEIAYNGFMNVYPVNTTNIDTNIKGGSYDLKAISLQDEQGFAALDYLLFGLANSDTEILSIFTQDVNAASYKKYLNDLVLRMKDMTSLVLEDWEDSYRDAFINNNGSSVTSSLDKLINDYVFHYEKHLRAGKIGIPAGVFSSTPLDAKVEAYYQGDLSKTLFLANLNALQNFFNGKGKEGVNGKGIDAYLKFLNTIKGGEDLSKLINNQFDIIRNMTSDLDNNFSNQIKSNNTLMLQTYDELQKNVIFLKVDMLQALSITVDYVDADGD